MIYKSVDEVWKAAKEAFKDIKRTSYEKKMMKLSQKPKKHMVGFIDGMREITVYRQEQR